jgi:hypothetical protein
MMQTSVGALRQVGEHKRLCTGLGGKDWHRDKPNTCARGISIGWAGIGNCATNAKKGNQCEELSLLTILLKLYPLTPPFACQ